MPKRMLIDASHPEETRVVVLDGNRVEEFDFEAASKRPLKGNIYLAKVTRVEPSLQAAFVEYGGNRQGFLAFSEIHPDYYQIPVADRMALIEAQTKRLMEEDDIDSFETNAPKQGSASRDEGRSDEQHAEDGDSHRETESDEDSAEDDEAPSGGFQSGESYENDAHADEDAQASHGGEEAAQNPEPVFAEGENTGETTNAIVQAESTGAPQPHRRREPRTRTPRRRQYKIQEVIKRRQIMLVQVVKEERGNKGASLTTFLSLAGRYCVLMPNTPRGGGISRKITSATDRKRLKSAAQSLELPEGMGLIIRTAGANRTKVEIKRDYEYLLRLWDTVRELTLKSNAPALVYEEGSLIKRAIRDLYNKDIDEIAVDGDAGYRDAKDFMRMLMPSHAKNVRPYKEALPLFQHYHVEAQLDAMFSPTVNLRSGGYIVINQTEALVSIDVNSGKATREHNIEDTAHKTNLEAADEIARQLRLRDLAGLIVIDFIDMEDSKNDRNVEKRLHNAVRGDRARIQIGKISQFGLLEMSRQRLRAGVVAGSTVTCPHCAGLGIIRSIESAALRLLRALDEEGQKQGAANLSVKAPPDVTIYALNQKRREVQRIEDAYDLGIFFDPQSNMMGGSFEIERTGVRIPTPRPKPLAISIDAGFLADEPEDAAEDVTIVEAPSESAAHQDMESTAVSDGEGSEGAKRKRRRRRRGGRGRGNPGETATGDSHADAQGGSSSEGFSAEAGQESGSSQDESAGDQDGEWDETGAQTEGEGGVPANVEAGPEGAKRRRRRRGRRGRRREGEPGSALEAVSGNSDDSHGAINGTAHEPDAAPLPVDEAQPRDEIANEVSGIVPNAPSSPQWSLAEHAPETKPLRHTETPSAPRVAPPEAEPVREPAAVHESAVHEGTSTDQPPGEPQEARKGWWQRRFKI
jgi:ribonuclease E